MFYDLSHYTNKFYYGRYDIKCKSIEDLKLGKNFSILEFNGCGAEPNHIYDAGLKLRKAYREILKHWKALYQISRYNRKNGTPYWTFRRGQKFLKEAKRHFKMLEKFDWKFDPQKLTQNLFSFLTISVEKMLLEFMKATIQSQKAFFYLKAR